MPDSFLDTDVFVYTFDHTAPQKRSRAREIIRGALAGAIPLSPLRWFKSF